MTEKAIILAAGAGKRMRSDETQSALSDQQAAVVAEGLKTMIPIDRPFLDYSLSSLADAGYRTVCLVIGPRHDRVRDYYSSVSCKRLTLEFAVQPEPLGTANALAAAADFAANDPVLVLNGDNYYPANSLRAVRNAVENAVVGFKPDTLIAKSNIPSDRVAAYSAIEQDDDGYLRSIVEKADVAKVQQPEVGAPRTPRLIGMNCWRFGPTIFQACRAIDRSSRGEYEIPDAVMHTILSMGERYRVIPSDDGVLDLSNQDDIASVTRWLQNVEVNL